MQVMARLRSAFGVDLPLRLLFDTATARELAAAIDRRRCDGPIPDASPIAPVPRTDALELSFSQQRMWFADQLDPQSAHYNVSVALRATGPLYRAALDAALSTLLERHEILRARFPSVDGQPRYAWSEPAPLLHVDLTGCSICSIEAAHRVAAQEAVRPFDLARGPLVRRTLVRIAPDDHLLLLSMHHIVTDGWSMEILVRELGTLYDAFSRGRRPALPELTVQYVDVAAWQRRTLRGAPLEKQLTFWRRQLADLPSLRIPVDRASTRRTRRMRRGAAARAQLSSEVRRRLIALGREEGATLFMVVMAAFQAVLAQYAGQDDVVVGTAVANRSRAELEPLIGFFVNHLVIRTDVSGNPSFRALLARVRRVLLDAYAHQDIPFEQVVQHVAPSRTTGDSPLFQTMLILQHASKTTMRTGEVTLEVWPSARIPALRDLTLYVTDSPDGIDCTLIYDVDLFTAATAERLLGDFLSALDVASETPDRAVAGLLAAAPGESSYDHLDFLHALE
jgi:hypothetical protein